MQTGSWALANMTGRAGPQAVGKPAAENVCAYECLQERGHLWAALHLNASSLEQLEIIHWSYSFVLNLVLTTGSGFCRDFLLFNTNLSSWKPGSLAKCPPSPSPSPQSTGAATWSPSPALPCSALPNAPLPCYAMLSPTLPCPAGPGSHPAPCSCHHLFLAGHRGAWWDRQSSQGAGSAKGQEGCSSQETEQHQGVVSVTFDRS